MATRRALLEAALGEAVRSHRRPTGRPRARLAPTAGICTPDRGPRPALPATNARIRTIDPGVCARFGSVVVRHFREAAYSETVRTTALYSHVPTIDRIAPHRAVAAGRLPVSRHCSDGAMDSLRYEAHRRPPSQASSPSLEFVCQSGTRRWGIAGQPNDAALQPSRVR